MTTYTLAGLKSKIADDILRSDLTTQIADEISSAIKLHQSDRFYFNESRTTTFSVVAGQTNYNVGDDADIPNFLEVDQCFLTDSNGKRYPLSVYDAAEIHWLLGNGASTGRPYSWAYYDRSFVLYPIPDTTYTCTPMGHIIIAEPASNDEADNEWMTEAFELIRCRAKEFLFTHTIKDDIQREQMKRAADRALSNLRDISGRKIGPGRIEPTTF